MAYCAESKTCLFACELFSTPLSVQSTCRFLFCVLEGWNEPWCSFVCSELLPFSLFTKRTDRMNIVYVSLSPSSSVWFFVRMLWCKVAPDLSGSRTVCCGFISRTFGQQVSGSVVLSIFIRAILSCKKTMFDFVWFDLHIFMNQTFQKLSPSYFYEILISQTLPYRLEFDFDLLNTLIWHIRRSCQTPEIIQW